VLALISPGKGRNFFRYFAEKGSKFRENFAKFQKFRKFREISRNFVFLSSHPRFPCAQPARSALRLAPPRLPTPPL
jgi:hypothetical protein